MKMIRRAIVLCLLLPLAACREDAPIPGPVAMTAEAVGHYCQMGILEHPGPKAQVHLDGLPAPLFFSQVRDAVAYQRMPEQSGRIVAMYVSDMGAARGWDAPGPENWILAQDALFVVDSAVSGGMGAPELVPFSDRAAAAAFVAASGGQILSLAEVPDEAVLTPVELDHHATTADDADFEARLRKLKPSTEALK